MKALYDPSQPIKVLFEQIEDTIDLAGATNAACTPQQIVTYAYNIDISTGVFTDAYHKTIENGFTVQYPGFGLEFYLSMC
jgi:hypothetical protein